jgi:AcrR family transcriptional regulator
MVSRAKSDLTRERLLDVATRLLIERGYHQVGMDEIAREAGVSRQAVYQGHFRTKAELLLALVHRSDQLVDIPGRVARVLAAPNGVEALNIAVDVVMSIEGDVHDISRIFQAARIDDPAFEAAWQDEMRRRRGLWQRVARRLAAEDRLVDGLTADQAADLLWAITSVWTYQALVVERGWTLERCVTDLTGALRRMLVRD